MATKDELIKGLEVLITESKRISSSLTDQQWEGVVDLDGWKNREVLAHIASIGGIVIPMVSGIASAPAGADPLAAADIDGMNAGLVGARAGKSAKELSDEVETAYRGIIDWVRAAPDELLSQHATARGHKDIEVSDIIMRMVVLHGLAHVYSVYSVIFFGG
jgi:hypothetical protein